MDKLKTRMPILAWEAQTGKLADGSQVYTDIEDGVFRGSIKDGENDHYPEGERLVEIVREDEDGKPRKMLMSVKEEKIFIQVGITPKK